MPSTKINPNLFIKYIFLIGLVVPYACLFIYTPDYLNYVNDWFDGSLLLYSDPLARLYYMLFSEASIIHVLSILIPLLVYVGYSSHLSMCRSILVMLAYPVLYLSLQNPRYFIATILMLFALIMLIHKKLYASTLMVLLSAGFHFGSFVILPFYIYVLFKKLPLKFVIAMLLIGAFSIFLFFYYDIYSLVEYRFEFAFENEDEKSKPYVHYITFLTLVVWFIIYDVKIPSSIRQLTIPLINFYICLIAISFFWYNLIISRLFHSLGIFVVYIIVASHLNVYKTTWFCLVAFIPVSFAFLLDGHYFSNDVAAYYYIFLLMLLAVLLFLKRLTNNVGRFTPTTFNH